MLLSERCEVLRSSHVKLGRCSQLCFDIQCPAGHASIQRSPDESELCAVVSSLRRYCVVESNENNVKV